MALKLPPPKKPIHFKSIPLEKRERIPAAVQFNNILVTAIAPERLRWVGIRMLNQEQRELEFMQRYQTARRIVLTGYLKKGKITVKKFNDEMGVIDKKIRQKFERFGSIRKKLNVLLKGRVRAVRELALNDPMYTFIKGHKAFSEGVQRRLATKGLQTIAFVDVDRLKETNKLLGYRGGGTKLLRAYAEAAEEMATKHKGLASHYGGDEFTFHFYRDAAEVASIMREFQVVALRKIVADEKGTYGALTEAIRKKEIPGTATIGVMQVNFALHEKKLAEQSKRAEESGASEIRNHSAVSIAERRAIYSSIMDAVSKPLSAKEDRLRGSVLIIKDEAKEAERKR